jgi:hypothetical protein
MAEPSDNDSRALEANFSQWSAERAPSLQPSDAFERYTVDQILKDADLSDEEIASGIFGGGDNGGVEGMYLFMNDLLGCRNQLVDMLGSSFSFQGRGEFS